MDTSAALELSALEATRHWMSVYPRKYFADGTAQLPSEMEITALAKNAFKVIKWRKRFADLGWFMKAHKEPIARRANREADVAGAWRREYGVFL